jgi:hypothetical protein
MASSSPASIPHPRRQSIKQDGYGPIVRRDGETVRLSGYIGAGADIAKEPGQGLSGLSGGAKWSMPPGSEQPVRALLIGPKKAPPKRGLDRHPTMKIAHLWLRFG